MSEWRAQFVMAAWAGWLVFVATAGLDGSMRRFGLAGVLAVGGLGGFGLAMVLVPFRHVAERAMKRWPVPGIKRLQKWFARPRVALSLWTCVAFIAGTHAAAGVWKRVAARAWERLPVWHWGLELELSFQRETLNSMACATAIVVLALALLEVLRIARSSRPK